MTWKRVVATAGVTSLLALAAAYGVGTAVQNGASASPELAPRNAQPSRSQHATATPTPSPAAAPTPEASPTVSDEPSKAPTSDPTTAPTPVLPDVVLKPGDSG